MCHSCRRTRSTFRPPIPAADRARGDDDPGGQAAAGHDRGCGKPTPPQPRADGVHPPHRHSLLQHADGQGRHRRRHQPVDGNGRPVGAGLRARGDRQGRPHRHHRARHGGEAAVHHGADRTQGDPHRLHAGECRAGLLSPRRGDRRRRLLARDAGRPAGRQAAERRRTAPVARADPATGVRPRHRGPLPADTAADRQRRPQGDAGGWHRLPRQRHVQDLVRPQLPLARRQHAAARQRARHDGSRPAVGDDGQAAPSRTGGSSPCAATAAS